jgi:hypothetical protein
MQSCAAVSLYLPSAQGKFVETVTTEACAPDLGSTDGSAAYCVASSLLKFGAALVCSICTLSFRVSPGVKATQNIEVTLTATVAVGGNSETSTTVTTESVIATTPNNVSTAFSYTVLCP